MRGFFAAVGVWASLSVGLAQTLVTNRFYLLRDATLGAEEFRIETSRAETRVYALDSQGAAWGLQVVRRRYRGERTERGVFQDGPAFPYRAVMIDVARRFHSLRTLFELVDECAEARIGLMQLHLTDDQNWMFPSTVLEGIDKGNTHGKPAYTVAELESLQDYAYARGVRLVPEIDLPGHSTLLVKHDESVFKIDGSPSGNCVNFASPVVRARLKALLVEVMEVFDEAPYIHIGGDEAWYPETEGDEDFRATVKRLGEGADASAVFVEFVGELASFVLEHGKTPVVWEGFGRSDWAKRFIPKETVVIAWEGHYYSPDLLVEDGYRVVNAGWDPLYVVDHYPGDNFTMVGLERLLGFDPWRVGTVNRAASPFEWRLDRSGRVEGAMMCWWEGKEEHAMMFLPDRIQALGWRLWTGVENKRGLEPPKPGRSRAWPLPEATAEHLARGAMVRASGTVDGFGAERLVDGVVDRLGYWLSFPTPAVATIDLGVAKEVSEVTVLTFWDGSAVSRYTVEVSLDGVSWSTVADASGNEVVATEAGYRHAFEARPVRFLRVTALGSSKYPSFSMGRIVEVIVR